MAPQLEREDVDLTALIKNILDNYPAGSATLREILQNSDDAGSRIQRFILDTRTFPSNKIIDPVLQPCQGPAIISVNDTFFEPKDWESVRNIHASSKNKDEGSTGKYGLGFRSCYHITDTPHILSGDKLLVLDPHQRIKSLPGGFSINTHTSDRQQYADHFAPFASVLSDDDPKYDGTAIRYPLRLEEHASSSRIKNSPTTLALARQMFNDFIARELPEVMLFLRHITQIELSEVSKDGTQRVLGKAYIRDAENAYQRRSKLRNRDAESSHQTLTIELTIGNDRTTRRWLLEYFVEDYDMAAQLLATSLNGKGITDMEAIERVKQSMAEDKLVGSIALALPLPEQGIPEISFSGRLFTLLPLPIHTSFPLHINAIFALTSSRQNLKNAEDANAGSREEFLIQWNRLIFTELVPKAWAAMLLHLVTLLRPPNIFDMWPIMTYTPDGDQSYWYPVPSRLLDIAGSLAIWPVLSGRDHQVLNYSPLPDVLVVSDMDDALVAALRSCSVPLVSPPSSIAVLLEKSPQFSCRLTSPARVYTYLQGACPAISRLGATEAKLVLDYLASTKDFGLLQGLPLIPNATEGRTTIMKGRTYTLAAEIEASMFDEPGTSLLAAWKLSPSTESLLLTSDQVHNIRPCDVVLFLERLYGGRGKAVNSAKGKPRDVERLVDFWGWCSTQWSGAKQLFEDTSLVQKMEKLHILPLVLDAQVDARPELRRASGLVLDLSTVDTGLRDALRAIGLPVLHGGVNIQGPARERFVKSADAVQWMLGTLRMQTFNAADLNQSQRCILHGHFSQVLLSKSRTTSFEPAEKEILRRLPIFPILSTSHWATGTSHFDIAPPGDSFGKAGSLFVDESVQVIPTIPGSIFIHYPDSRPLATALGVVRGEGEIAILERVIEKSIWRLQASIPGLSELLVDRIIRRLNDSSIEFRKRVADLPIIPVASDQSSPNLKSPSRVVDPKSKIASLYDPEDAVLPTGVFADDAPGSYTQQLRSCDMLVTELSDIALSDRLGRLADIGPNALSNADAKALDLLGLLDEQATSTQFSLSVTSDLCSQAWLPGPGGRRCRPSECWDSRPEDVKLCDLVFPIIPAVVKADRLRKALGWTQLPFQKLCEQFVAVTRRRSAHLPPTQRSDASYILPLLREIAKRLAASECSEGDLQELADAVGDSEWVPVSEEACLDAQHAMLDAVSLEKRFQRVHSPLADDQSVRTVLELMGVSPRPTVEALCAELRSLSLEIEDPKTNAIEKQRLIQTSLLLIQELRDQSVFEDSSSTSIQAVLVPTTESNLKPLNDVIFNDIPYGVPSPPKDTYFAHKSISPELAETMVLRRLSDEQFAQDDDEVQTFVMAEDLTDRIQNVLKDYDVDYASNEWVANAADAKASEVKIVVDEALFAGQRVVGPSFKDFQSCPALVVYNDGVFSEADFNGLGNVGTGGKRGTLETIGRFGLGALSFYHFGERLMLVSAGEVLFLDPSQKYLPRLKKSRAKRSGMRMSIDACRVRFPDQLTALDGMFGFTQDTSYYEGTLFHVPLRTVSQAKDSKLIRKSYSALSMSDTVARFFDSATQSLFFSKLRGISALRRGPDLELSELWSARASRQDMAGDNTTGAATELALYLVYPTRRLSREEKWLICTTASKAEDFPKSIQPAFSTYRLPHPTFGVAHKILPISSPQASRIFATLPLPIQISLPIHIHATFVASNDRRAIRLDPADHSGNRPLDCQYNDHILRNCIPPLYIRAVAIVAADYGEQLDRVLPTGTPNDLVSRIVKEASLKHFASTPSPLLRTVMGKPIVPSKALLRVEREGFASVSKVLSGLQVPDYVLTQPFSADEIKKFGLRMDGPEEVARVLRSAGPSPLKKMLEVTGEKGLQHEDINDLIQFLLKGGESLLDVPLLLLGDGDLVSFKSRGAPTVFTSLKADADITHLFGPDKIIHPKVNRNTIDLIKQKNLNLQALTEAGMRELFQRSDERITPTSQKSIQPSKASWYNDVLRFLEENNETGLRLENFKNLPLIPTTSLYLVLSLEHALEGESAWCRSRLLPDDPFLPILQHIKIPIVDPRTHAYTNSSDNLARVLKIIGRGDDLEKLHRAVPRAQWDSFVEWFKRLFTPSGKLSLGIQESRTLSSLPLFLATKGGSEREFFSCDAVFMLPESVHSTSFSRYLPPDTPFAEYSWELVKIFDGLHISQRCLGSLDLIGRLRLPEVISQVEESDYQRVLDLVIHSNSGLYSRSLIPDGNRSLQVPSSLYDPRTELFRQCFPNRPQLFVHPSFRRSMDSLVRLGVIDEKGIRSSHLLACAEALDEDTRAERDTGERARYLWKYLPTSPVLGGLEFSLIEHLRFIPSESHPIRHRDPALSAYVRVLPPVVTPSEVCGPEDLPVTWTTRAACSTLIPRFIKALYPALGVPTPIEVIEHLEVLATVIAPKHPHNKSLTDDLKATYEWLQKAEHIGEAGSLLKDHRRPLWLNVEGDPLDNQSPWIWRSAKELAFDWEFDGEENLYDVKSFLKGFKELLIAAGANQFKAPEQGPATKSHPEHEEFWRRLNQLRKKDKYLDVELRVQAGEVVKAHRVALAAAVPHFDDLFSRGGVRDSVSSSGSLDSDLTISLDFLDTPVVAMRSAIEFVYTWSLPAPPTNTTEEARGALENLLQLLKLAHSWDIAALKEQTETLIVKLVRPGTWDTIEQHAVAYRSNKLVKVCQDSKRDNKWASSMRASNVVRRSV